MLQRPRRLGVLLVALLFLGACDQTVVPLPTRTAAPVLPAPTSAALEPPGAATTTPSLQPPASGAIRMDQLQFGVVTHLFYTDRPRTLTLARIGGFDWVRQQIHWKDVEAEPGVYYWDEVDPIVADVTASGLKLLVNIVQAPSFYSEKGGKPDDPQAMGDFVEAMVRHYGTQIGAIEIWNEPNLAVENGGRVTDADPGRYVELLIECYTRIKAIEPSIIVLLAAPSSTGVRNETIAMPDRDYLRAVYTYRNGIVKDYFDAQAAHPGAAANPPATLYPEKPSWIDGCTPAPDRCWNDDPTHYFRHIENIRALMVEYGLGDHQIWITEYGWATPNNTPNFEFGQYTSLERQAEYVSAAVQQVYSRYRDEQGRPWVGAMFLWNLNFAVLWGGQNNPEHEQASFSILNPDWSPRPTFLALQGLHQRLKTEQGR